MLFIAHRGNLYGPRDDTSIEDALKAGFDVSIDVWWHKGAFWTGVMEPKSPISREMLLDAGVWCVPRNEQCRLELMELGARFLEDAQDAVCFPEKNHEISEKDMKKCGIILSDYVWHYKRRLTAKTRIAMMISGRIKCYERNLMPQMKAFHSEHPDVYIDLFVAVNANMDEEHVRFYETMFPTMMFIQPYQCEQKYIYHPFIRGEFEGRRHMIGNFMSHFYNNMVAYQLLMMFKQQNPDIVYDKVMLFRADINRPDLPPIMELEVPSKTVVFPSSHRYMYDWINMHVVLGNMETMRIYCDLVHWIDQYLYQMGMILHPETMITEHLKLNSVAFKEYTYEYVLDSQRN